jgi:hypothetical protein
MVQFIIFGLKFIGTFSLRNCDCLNAVSFTILEKVSINSKNYNPLHRFFKETALCLFWILFLKKYYLTMVLTSLILLLCFLVKSFLVAFFMVFMVVLIYDIFCILFSYFDFYNKYKIFSIKVEKIVTLICIKYTNNI